MSEPGPDELEANLLPVPEHLKDLAVACSACSQRAPFTLRQFEQGPVMAGWQLRLIATEVRIEEEPGRAWRWDLFCPACAGEMSPQPADSLRIRVRVAE